MTFVLAWLARPWWLGLPVWRWILCTVLAVLAVVLWFVGQHWLGYAIGTLGLPWRLQRPPVTYDTPDDAARARDALRAHSAAQEADRALADVALAERAAGDAGRQAAATDPLDVVAARVEARARRGKP